jgi:hypothetical protein
MYCCLEVKTEKLVMSSTKLKSFPSHFNIFTSGYLQRARPSRVTGGQEIVGEEEVNVSRGWCSGGQRPVRSVSWGLLWALGGAHRMSLDGTGSGWVQSLIVSGVHTYCGAASLT